MGRDNGSACIIEWRTQWKRRYNLCINYENVDRGRARLSVDICRTDIASRLMGSLAIAIHAWSISIRRNARSWSQSARCNVLLPRYELEIEHTNIDLVDVVSRSNANGRSVFCSFPVVFSSLLVSARLRAIIVLSISSADLSLSLLAVSLLFGARRSRRKDACSTHEYNFAYGSPRGKSVFVPLVCMCVVFVCVWVSVSVCVRV